MALTQVTNHSEAYMRIGNREYRIDLIIITVALALPILINVVNGMNSRMLADDYCFAATVQNKGWMSAMSYYYYNWQGTFSSTAVQSAIALTGGGLVRWLPALIIVIWWAGLIYLIWQLCQLLSFKTPFLFATALATMVLYAILDGAPTMFQSIYWTSGSVTYSIPLVLFTLWGGLSLQAVRKSIPLYALGISTPIIVITAGLLAGFSPIFAVFEITLLALLLLALWFWRPQNTRSAAIWLGMSLIGALVGTIIMVAAPGNSIRQSFFDKPPTLPALIRINLLNSGFFVGMDLYQVSLLPHLVLLVVGGWLIATGTTNNSSLHNKVKRAPRKWLMIALAIALLILFGLFLPTSYNISQFPPGRALIIPHVVMVVLSLTWGGVMALSLKKYTKEKSHTSWVMIGATSVLLLIGPIFATGKSISLSPKLQTFATEWDTRDTLIRQAILENKSTVSVPPFTVDLAKYAYVNTVEDSFASCLEDYYHIEKLIVQK